MKRLLTAITLALFTTLLAPPTFAQGDPAAAPGEGASADKANPAPKKEEAPAAEVEVAPVAAPTPSPSPAEERLLQEALQEPAAAAPSASSTPSLGYTVSVMLFGAGLLALLGWGARRVGFPGEQRVQGEEISVLDTVSLGATQRVSLLEVDGRRLLVGYAGGAITTLGEWAAARSEAPARQPDSREGGEGADAIFERARARFKRQLALVEGGEGEGRAEVELLEERAPEDREELEGDDTAPARDLDALDGSLERDSVLISLRALEARHGGGRS